jgi:hypothetical protein
MGSESDRQTFFYSFELSISNPLVCPRHLLLDADLKVSGFDERSRRKMRKRREQHASQFGGRWRQTRKRQKESKDIEPNNAQKAPTFCDCGEDEQLQPSFQVRGRRSSPFRAFSYLCFRQT